MKNTAFTAITVLAVTSCHHAAPAVAVADYATVVNATDREPADIALDSGRKPEAFLQFVGAKSGDKVAELFAGGGYTTELLARAVGPTGVVYGQNSKFVLERFAEKPWAARLNKPAMKAVVRVDRELEEPLPAEATNLDVVVSNAIYHDTVWLQTDRSKMNRSVYAALRPGGSYVVCDSSSVAGHGIEDAATLHRIDEQTVRTEVAAAGFEVAAAGDFLRNKDDTRDWNASPPGAGVRRGQSDRFCFKFVKPTK